MSRTRNTTIVVRVSYPLMFGTGSVNNIADFMKAQDFLDKAAKAEVEYSLEKYKLVKKKFVPSPHDSSKVKAEFTFRGKPKENRNRVFLGGTITQSAGITVGGLTGTTATSITNSYVTGSYNVYNNGTGEVQIDPLSGTVHVRGGGNTISLSGWDS